jgi:hypothetical protein
MGIEEERLEGKEGYLGKLSSIVLTKSVSGKPEREGERKRELMDMAVKVAREGRVKIFSGKTVAGHADRGYSKRGWAVVAIARSDKGGGGPFTRFRFFLQLLEVFAKLANVGAGERGRERGGK